MKVMLSVWTNTTQTIIMARLNIACSVGLYILCLLYNYYVMLSGQQPYTCSVLTSLLCMTQSSHTHKTIMHTRT